MRDDIFDAVRITPDGEIKAPRAVHTGLPNVAGFIVLVRAE
jgi:hypothetical protein